MTDILLINPFSWTRDGRAAYIPYGILYLASYLRKRNINVEIHDCNAQDGVMEHIKASRPRAIGLSVLTGPVIKEALKISRETKALYSGIKVIWGGLHPTLFPESVSVEKSVDDIVRGEGEESLYTLLNDIPHHHIYNEARLIDLNKEPMPAWDMLPDIERYVMNKHYGDRVLTVNTSRGCVNDCAFCFNGAMRTHRWRALSGEQIFAQVMTLYLRYNINGVQFYEDNFDVDKNRVETFCKRMIQFKLNRHIKWAHFSCVKKADKDLIEYEREAGCREIGYGVESGSNRILQLLNKHQTTQDIERAFKICRRAKVKATSLFMIGLPTETKDDISRTSTLINRLHSYQDICTIYRPYPKTRLHDMLGLRTPVRLEDQADYYAYGELNENVGNVSDVRTGVLIHIQRYFHINTLKKELFSCLWDFNIRRLRYLLKEGFRWLKAHTS